MSDHCYIGVKDCGCVVAAVVDNPEHRDDVIESVIEFMRAGLTIERVGRDEACDRLAPCECTTRPPAGGGGEG